MLIGLHGVAAIDFVGAAGPVGLMIGAGGDLLQSPDGRDDVSVCSSWWKYWAMPFCWERSQSAWREMAQFQAPPMPPAVGVPPNLTMPPASGPDATRTIDSVLAGQMTDWQTQTQDFFEQQPYVPADYTTLWTWLAVGGALLAGAVVLGKVI